MRLIGITGGIACGKSTVTRMLRELGAVVIDADKISRDLTAVNQAGWRAVMDAFGRDVLLPDGNLDRKALGERIFHNAQEKLRLESVLHPLIRAAMGEEISRQRLAGERVIFLDVPLLFEVGWHKFVDEVWFVYADRETQLARLVARDGLSVPEAERRMDAQLQTEKKMKLADVVIDNRATLRETFNQVSAQWHRLMNEITE